MTPFKLKSKIDEIKSYIASDWPSIEQRKELYKELKKLEETLAEMINEENSKNKQ